MYSGKMFHNFIMCGHINFILEGQHEDAPLPKEFGTKQTAAMAMTVA